MKAEITATNEKSKATLRRIVEVSGDNIKDVELEFLNDYINRDCEIKRYSSVAEACKFAKLKIESRELKDE